MSHLAGGHRHCCVAVHIGRVTTTKDIVDGRGVVFVVFLNCHGGVAVHCRLVAATEHTASLFFYRTVVVEHLAFNRGATLDGQIGVTYLTKAFQGNTGIDILLL